jgi:peptidoglycan/LPS O-acetylase OafA/YrhL
VRRFEWANALRGVAALTVLGCHFAIAFWLGQEVSAGLARRRPLYLGDTGAPQFARALNALPVDFAALGVGLFFLLSGFVIAISLERYSRRGFLVGRCMRVLPTYAAGYLVTCSVVFALSDPNKELSAGAVLGGTVPGLAYVLGIPAPADGIVWTLIVELVFYAVCLVAYRALTRHWQAIVAVAAGCVAMQWLLSQFPPGASMPGLRFVVLLACPFIPVMLVGVVLSAHRRGSLGRVAVALLVPLLAATNLLLATTTPVVPTALKYRLTFVGTIALFTAIWMVGDRWKPHPVAGFFADISYPLYVVHAVLGYAAISYLSAHGVPAVVAVLGASGAAIGAAWVLHKVVEVPTHHLGQRWARSIAYAPAADHPSPVRAGPVLDTSPVLDTMESPT